MPNTYFASKEEFENTIERSFAKLLSEKLPQLIRKATEKKYFTIDEACELLDCSRRHLQYLRSSGQINFIKNGQKVYLRRKDIEDFFNENLIRAEEQ